MKQRWWVVGLGLLAAIVLALSPLQAKQSSTRYSDDFYKQTDLFEDALDKVRTNYVEEPQPKQLIYGALKGMLATLDPYSQFLDPDSYNELKVDTEGQF